MYLCYYEFYRHCVDNATMEKGSLQMEKGITERNKKVLLIVLIAGCFLSTLNQTLLNVAMSNLMEVFDVTAATVQWLSTGFMLVNGVLVPITAFLMKRFYNKAIIY